MVRTGYRFEPSVVFPPGETLRELLQAREMTQVELAEKLDMSERVVSHLLNGKHPLTQETALKLENALGVDASFWNNLEARFQEFRVRQEEEERLRKELEFLRCFPTSEMIKRGLLSPLKGVELLKELLRYFQVANPSAWQKHWGEGRLAAFRKTNPGKNSEYAVAVWLRAGEIAAEELEVGPFSKKKFREALQSIREMIPEPPESLSEELVRLCAEAGVAFVLMPQLKGTGIAGATRWVHRSPILQLSLRHKREDYFWFAFFHEAAHILLHGKTEVFWETSGKVERAVDEKEEEANEWARNLLISEGDWSRFLSEGRPWTEERILRFARECGTAPAILVGRLQHEREIHYSEYLDLVRSVNWVDESKGEIEIK